MTVTIIMKTIIGASILSLPLTLSKLGYVAGLIIFTIVILIVQFTCTLLLKSKNLSRHSNYSSISYHIFHNKFSQIAVSFAILMNNLGICIMELIIIKGSIRKIITDYVKDDSITDSWYTQEWMIVILVAVAEIPFTIVKKIEKLKILTFIGVAGITLFVIALVINFVAEMSEPERGWYCHPDMVPFADEFLEMASVVPNMMLAFAFQMNFFPIFKGLKNSSYPMMSQLPSLKHYHAAFSNLRGQYAIA